MSDQRRQQRLAGFDDLEAPAAPPHSTEPRSAPRGDRDVRRESGQVESLQGATVYAVDAHSLIYQVFHALPEMSGPAGQPVGAIHGFLRDVVEILESRRPDYLLCAFDAPGDTFRHAFYPQYKADRPSMPLDLQLQIPNIQRFLDAMGIPALALAGYEADDILATIARQASELGGACYLVTNDKDCRQLITDRVKLFNVRKREVVDADEVIRQWGIRPEQVIDFQALWGDSTDNIPGVPGIGQKTAAQLLQQYGDLEQIYEQLDGITAKRCRERLAEGREAAWQSRRLVRLDDEVPIELPWGAARVGGMDVERVEQLCAEFGFQSLRQRLTGLAVTAAPARWEARYETVATAAALAELVDTLSRQSTLSVDTETTSTHARQAELVGCALAWQPGHAVYLPFRAPPGEPCLDGREALEALRPVLENPRIEKVGQNLKYDMIVLRGAGVELAGVAFDTMVADYLLAPGERNHSLDDLAKRYLNHETVKIRELIGTGKSQIRMDQVPVEKVTAYAGEDADVALRLAAILAERLRGQGLERLFFELEMPLMAVLAEMEFHGIRIDVAHLQQLSRQYGDRIERVKELIVDLAGVSFNLDSPRQLAQVLFDQLKLPIRKKTKTGSSTDADVLTELAPLHPLPARIIEYRQLAKLKSTYIDALPSMVHAGSGRVHTSFKQDVAATGRLSSADPNLQNIPVRSADGREIRAAFVPGHPGWQLLCADYSQIELRVLAHCSGDETLRLAFENDRDIHAQVASQVNQVPLSEVTPDMRRAAKAIHFGIIYGQSAFGLARSLGIGKPEATAFIEAYFAQYPQVREFMVRTLAQCRRDGYVSTLLGRRRSIRGIRELAAQDAIFQRNLPERIAINTVIQGSAADLIKLAMIQVYRRMQRERLESHLLLQIHDELVLEAPPGELGPLSNLVAEEMSSVCDLSVPLKVDLKAGTNWAQCDPLAGPLDQ